MLEHLAVTQGASAAQLIYIGQRTLLLDQTRHGFGYLIHMDGLNRLMASARQCDDRQAGQCGKKSCALAAGTVNQRWPQDGPIHPQCGQGFIGEQFAVQVGCGDTVGVSAHTQGRDLNHPGDACRRCAAKQLDRALRVHTLKTLPLRWHQDADTVDHRINFSSAQTL